VKYVVYGVGAIGGIIAAHLARAGAAVTVIARGETLAAIRRDGLCLQSPSAQWRVPVEVVEHPGEISLSEDDAVVLATKTQDSIAALQALVAVAPPGIALLCAQNGVENERIAQRFFDRVYGMFVFIFGTHPRPGLVQCFTTRHSGVLDLGLARGGADGLATRVARQLGAAGFDSVARPDIMRWKHSKLLANLANAFVAAYGSADRAGDLLAAAQAEGRACYAAAGIEAADPAQFQARRQSLFPLGSIDGAGFPGGSSWQSLARGSGQTEVDYLAGEIALLGRRHGIATPVNSAMQALVRRMALDRLPAGSLDPAALRVRPGDSLQQEPHRIS
jgi:2-dehydropantoate 2-reductase